MGHLPHISLSCPLQTPGLLCAELRAPTPESLSGGISTFWNYSVILVLRLPAGSSSIRTMCDLSEMQMVDPIPGLLGYLSKRAKA